MQCVLPFLIPTEVTRPPETCVFCGSVFIEIWSAQNFFETHSILPQHGQLAPTLTNSREQPTSQSTDRRARPAFEIFTTAMLPQLSLNLARRVRDIDANGHQAGDFVFSEAGFQAVLERLFTQAGNTQTHSIRGLSATAIDRLPRAATNDLGLRNNLRLLSCAICQEGLIATSPEMTDMDVEQRSSSPKRPFNTEKDMDYNHEEIIVLPSCDHKFHAQCIIPWLLRVATCPVCRFQVES